LPTLVAPRTSAVILSASTKMREGSQLKMLGNKVSQKDLANDYHKVIKSLFR